MMVRWPDRIKAGQVSIEVIAMMDWMPTLLAAAGDAGVKEKLKKGMRVGSESYKVHLDGYNFLPYFTGQEESGPRNEFIYASDTGDIVAIRDGDYKLVFREQTAHGAETWINPYKVLRAPKLFNLRQDPFERMEQESENYYQWWFEHLFLLAPAMVKVAQFKATFKEFPQRQKPGSGLSPSPRYESMNLFLNGRFMPHSFLVSWFHTLTAGARGFWLAVTWLPHAGGGIKGI